MFSSTGLLKLQSLLRASNQTIDMSVIVRQADLSNMRAVLKEAKHNYWTHIIAELNITETELLLKMVSTVKCKSHGPDYGHYPISVQFQAIIGPPAKHNQDLAAT